MTGSTESELRAFSEHKARVDLHTLLTSNREAMASKVRGWVVWLVGV